MTGGALAKVRELVSLPAAPAPARFAFPFTSRYIKLALPPGLAGSYLLLAPPGRPLYVGRSDRCLRQRLLGHPLRGRATHFTAAVAEGPRGAYLLECYWWHRYRAGGTYLVNQLHPASYQGASPCPFCRETTAVAA